LNKNLSNSITLTNNSSVFRQQAASRIKEAVQNHIQKKLLELSIYQNVSANICIRQQNLRNYII